MIKIIVPSGEERYPVYLGSNIAKNLGGLVARHLSPGPCLLITDHNVAPYYATNCCRSLQEWGFKPYLAVLEGGERIKTTATAEMLYGKALELSMDRSSFIVALGGGVIGDLAGFVAATYLRGISFVQVPTSLLAMADSSVGGKVAVNHSLGKNIIGAFHHPKLVISDPVLLKTLSEREWRAGMAEVVKYGVMADAKLFSFLESLNQESLQHPRGRALIYLIARAVQLKAKIVSLDARERDQRRVLNLGHTFGHALETATDYSYYLHGEAVAVGMQMAAIMAQQLKVLDSQTAQRIIALVKKLKPPPSPPSLQASAVEKALFYDKKKEGDNTVFVLPEALGQVGFYKSVPKETIHTAIASHVGN